MPFLGQLYVFANLYDTRLAKKRVSRMDHHLGNVSTASRLRHSTSRPGR